MLQPTAWLFSLCLSCVCLEGIKSLRESCNGSGIVAKVYSMSRSTGMCFSQLDHLLCHRTHPDLWFLNELSDGIHTLRFTLLPGENPEE